MNKLVNADTIDNLVKSSSLLSTAIDGLLGQTQVGEPMGGWPDKFLPVQELAWDVRDLAEELYGAPAENATVERG